jgi:hypothetical protein
MTYLSYRVFQMACTLYHIAKIIYFFTNTAFSNNHILASPNDLSSSKKVNKLFWQALTMNIYSKALCIRNQNLRRSMDQISVY